MILLNKHLHPYYISQMRKLSQLDSGAYLELTNIGILQMDGGDVRDADE